MTREYGAFGRELIVDSFAGGGGASTGIKLALGRSPDIAINHSGPAIAMHMRNHPETRHYCENIWKVDPLVATGGVPVGFAWYSPDCRHFSRAKGGKPNSQKIRGLAWVVYHWAREVRPRCWVTENVCEIKDWGPLLENGRPDPLRKGMTFRRWWRQLENLGYVLDARELYARDYGAPTARKRLFIIGRCDGLPIRWPEPTHGPGRRPYRTAAECIDWSIPCPSIFTPGRDLVENTLRRVARGVQRFVLDDPQPFIVTARGTEATHIENSARSIAEPLRTLTAGRGVHHSLVIPSLINTRNGERLGQAPRIHNIREPYPTVTAKGSQGALVSAFLAKHYGGHETDGQDLRTPMSTVTTKDHHALVYAFLLKYCAGAQAPALPHPFNSFTTRDGFVIVKVRGEEYYIRDIGMRHLVPRELYRAQGFPDDYIIDPVVDGRPLSKAEQTQMCGNSVSPPLAAAIVRANMLEEAEEAMVA